MANNFKVMPLNKLHTEAETSDRAILTTTGTPEAEDLELMGEVASRIPMQFVTLDTSPTGVTAAEGVLSWNSDDHTLNIQTDLADVTQQVGQETMMRVRNTSGATIANGSAVYLSGASGQRATIEKASASNAAHVSSTIGLATHDIEHNSFGYVTTMGLVRGVNTFGMTEGGAVYLSDTAGAFTQTAPTSSVVRVGWCIVAGVSGTILAHVERLSMRATDIIDSTSAGRTLLTAADASAQRTALGLSPSDSITLSAITVGIISGVTGTLEVKDGTTWQNVRIFSTTDGGSNFEYLQIAQSGTSWKLQSVKSGTGPTRGIQITPQGSLQLGANGGDGWTVNTSKHLVPDSTTKTRDIGTTSARARTVYAQDLNLSPSSSLTPSSNGDLVIEATSNTSLTLKLKGSDGVVRSAILTLI